MKICLRGKLVIKVVFMVFWLLILLGESVAEEYTIGVEDVLNISFWQQPQLDATVKVGENGKISLPMIGEIEAAGLTQKQLTEEIVARISLYDPTISQATVTVSEYNSRRVYVQGEVLHPGKYSFENIPGLWELIGEAGGPTEYADLSSITIIRGGPEGGVITVDLDRSLKSGDFTQLPGLKPKDIVNIPRSALSSTPSTAAPISLRKAKVYYLWGEVISPGAYPLKSQIDLTEAISLAGGPTSMANLKKIKLVKKGAGEDTIIVTNVDHYLKKGTPKGLMIDSDNIVIVPAKKPGTLSKTWGVIRDVVPLAGAVASVYLVVHTLRKEYTPTIIKD